MLLKFKPVGSFLCLRIHQPLWTPHWDDRRRWCSGHRGRIRTWPGTGRGVPTRRCQWWSRRIESPDVRWGIGRKTWSWGRCGTRLRCIWQHLRTYLVKQESLDIVGLIDKFWIILNKHMGPQLVWGLFLSFVWLVKIE